MSDFDTLTFQRRLPAAPDRVYAVLVDPRAREVWGGPSDDTVVIVDADQPAPAPGLREISCCGPRDNPFVEVATDWILMQPGARLVNAETLGGEGAIWGTTLATCDIDPDGDGTQLTITLQIASYAGPEAIADFRTGWTHAIDNIARYLERMPA